MKKTIAIILMLLCLAALSHAANLANPAAQVTTGRLYAGGSYYLGGSTITNMEIPMMQNRIGIRAGFAPISYFNIGFDAGTALISVDEYTVGNDTIPVFNSNFGWSAGGHVKLSTPFLFGYVSLFGLANGNLFWAENDRSAYYGGKEGVGVVGAQVRIPKFGYISVGPHVHLILGENKSYNTKKTDTYSNLNNVRGWIAFDYFPDIGDAMSDNKPYASIEFTASPKMGGSSRVPVQEFSLSISVGIITPRLYGVDKEKEWDEWEAPTPTPQPAVAPQPEAAAPVETVVPTAVAPQPQPTQAPQTEVVPQPQPAATPEARIEVIVETTPAQ